MEGPHQSIRYQVRSITRRLDNRFNYLGDASDEVANLIFGRVTPLIVVAQIAEIAEVLHKSPSSELDNFVVL